MSIVTSPKGSICTLCGYTVQQELGPNAQCPHCGDVELAEERDVGRELDTAKKIGDQSLAWALEKYFAATTPNTKGAYHRLAQLAAIVLLEHLLLVEGGEDEDEDEDGGGVV